MKELILFDNLQRYLDDLEEVLPPEEEFLQSKVHQYSLSMLMMNIINCCLDIGSEILNRKQLGVPGTYKEIFVILEKAKIISPSLTKKMKNLVGLRNLLAHEYGEINLALLYEQAQETKFIEEFIVKTLPCFR